MRLFKIFLTGVFILLAPCFIFPQGYYLEDGGAALRLNVLRTEGTSIAKADLFILDYIQNLLAGNFEKYTAVKTGRQNDQSSGQPAGTLLLISKLTRTGTNFVLDLTVTDAATGLRKASYQKANIAADSIFNAAAINEGFLDIVKKLNINLTEDGIAALRTPKPKDIEALLNLARGNEAQKNDNPIEMLTYLYNAASYNPDLLEAAKRFDFFSQMLSSGDVGASVKSDLADRENWKKILDEFDSFYKAHPPFILTYNPLPTQKGHTDYDNRTAVLEFELSFQEDISFEAMQKVYNAVVSGLKSTGNQELWGFATRPFRSPLFNRFRHYEVKAELVNERDIAVAAATFRVRGRIALLRNTLYADTTQKARQSFRPIRIDEDLTGNMLVRVVSIDGIGTEKSMQGGYVKITPRELLPKTKARNPLVLLTRDIKG
jgi:hypothetical protein